MAVKFTEKECGEIVQALRLAAARHAANGGMRKTTVDELAQEAGISKGAFYKFYSSKEYLFLDMLEEWHENIFLRAGEELKRCADFSPRERAAAMLKTAVRAMRVTPLEH
ncbi:MAG: TetR/AcrR family transcriptional regulator, partial [Clostridia bacterium]|nr:TetR/AcrR family transcriptional regulator [Clostridia bacterium]